MTLQNTEPIPCATKGLILVLFLETGNSILIRVRYEFVVKCYAWRLSLALFLSLIITHLTKSL